MKLKLTTANLVLPEGKDEEIFWDTELAHFGLRVRRRRKGGRVIRNWIIQYRQHGRAARMIAGSGETLTAPKARAKARKLLAEVELGGDPQADRRVRREKDSLSLRSVVADFISAKTDVKPSTLLMLKRYLEGPAYVGSLRSLPIDRITRKDVAARVIAVSRDSGVRTSLCFRGALSSLFSWALAAGLIEANPMIGAFRPNSPPSRDRVLSDLELAAIWNGVGDKSEYAAIVRLLICTAARRQEVGSMLWSEIGDETWTLPSTRSKTGKAHVLPITDLMRKVISSVEQRVGVDYLFGRHNGFNGWSVPKKLLDERLGLEPWTLHDIRRSVSTRMNDLGIAPPHVIERILGHSIGGSHGIYNRSTYATEVRNAMLRWSTHIAEIVESRERKVVAFERAAVASTRTQ